MRLLRCCAWASGPGRGRRRLDGRLRTSGRRGPRPISLIQEHKEKKPNNHAGSQRVGPPRKEDYAKSARP